MQGAEGFAWAAAGLGAYAFAFEPGVRLNVTSYRVTPPHWPDGLTLKAAVLADIHACEPWMPASRVRGIANLTNDLAPDIVFLLGDFSGGHRFVTGPVMPDDWGEALSVLKAPLGVYSVLGNHDWWHAALPGMPADGAERVPRLAFGRYRRSRKPCAARNEKRPTLLDRGPRRSNRRTEGARAFFGARRSCRDHGAN